MVKHDQIMTVHYNEIDPFAAEVISAYMECRP
jgi:hypothetical protein